MGHMVPFRILNSHQTIHYTSNDIKVKLSRKNKKTSCKRSPDIWAYYKYENKFRQIGHCLRMGQGQLRVIVYINFVELEHIMLLAKFHDHRTRSSVGEDF